MNIQELFNLKGRVAILTGGAGHKFGSQICTALAEAGAEVVITSRRGEKAKAKAEEYQAQGLAVHGAELDLREEEAIRGFVAQTRERFRRIDILVNNACANHLEAFETVKLDDWNRVLHTNVTAPLLLARAVAPHMLEQGKGSIINLSSIYGVVPPDQSIYGDSGLNSPLVYGATKAALQQMTKYWAVYWAPKIRVNTLTPGGLYNKQDPKFVENYNRKTPMGRMAGPDDLKGAALYLASDASAWVTGQNLIVDGGFTVW